MLPELGPGPEPDLAWWEERYLPLLTEAFSCGFDDDERDFSVGTSILTGMGVKAVRLLTNNPRKVARFMAEGIHVAERVPLWVGETRFNRDYLRIKAEKSGHMA